MAALHPGHRVAIRERERHQAESAAAGAVGLQGAVGWFMVAGLGQSSFIRQYFPLFFMPERDLILGGALALVLGFVAGIVPAIQAMRLRLADALRREG